MPRRWNRESSCTGKAQLPTAKLARQRASQLNARSDAVVEPYKCPFCNQYHLGSNRSLPKRQKLARELARHPDGADDE